jgi:signal transduction histidine kinase
MTVTDIAFDTLPWVWCLIKNFGRKTGDAMLGFVKKLEKYSRVMFIVASLLLVAAVGFVDYLTGHEISVSVFYLLGVAMAVWFVSGGFGVLISGLSVLVSVTSDLASGAKFETFLIPLWNAAVLLSFYLVVVWLLSLLRSLNRNLEGQVGQRTRALTEEILERERLERELLDISEREQRRIGQILHDSLCQHLTGTTLAAQVLEEKLAARQLPETAEASQVVGLIEEGINLSRKLAKGLYPVEVSSDGLMLALEEYAATTSKLFKVICRFECDSPVLIHDTATAGHLYRIAQEAVGNAIKHGKARNILITLAVSEESTLLSVNDDGTGLPAPLPKQRGMGLRIMAHRSDMVNALFSVRRNVLGGTEITCELKNEPLAATNP